MVSLYPSNTFKSMVNLVVMTIVENIFLILLVLFDYIPPFYVVQGVHGDDFHDMGLIIMR